MKNITFLYAYFIKKKKSLDLASLVWLKTPKAINKKKRRLFIKKTTLFFIKKITTLHQFIRNSNLKYQSL